MICRSFAGDGGMFGAQAIRSGIKFQVRNNNACADHTASTSRDGDVLIQVDVLNGVEQLNAFFHG